MKKQRAYRVPFYSEVFGELEVWARDGGEAERLAEAKIRLELAQIGIDDPVVQTEYAELIPVDNRDNL